MKHTIVHIILLLSSFFSFGQSDFYARWNDSRYDSLIETADNYFEGFKIDSALEYYSQAHQIRPTTYSMNRINFSSKISNSDSVLMILDSCLIVGAFCNAKSLIHALRKEYDSEKLESFDQRLKRPIHCDSRDEDFIKIIKKADELLLMGELENAKELFRRAIILNEFEDYPQHRLTQIENTE